VTGYFGWFLARTVLLHGFSIVLTRTLRILNPHEYRDIISSV
jgi:hypothetical protein